MMLSRRKTLVLGGGAFAALVQPRLSSAAAREVIEMRGTARGEHIWFSPQGLAVAVGTTLRFVNRDPGNSHTATAYHESLYGRARRIPAAATPWDSDFLLPDEMFETTLNVPGVYDYYCIPHEMGGMLGRIVVGQPGDPGWEGPAADTGDLTPEALASLPSVEDILASGRVERESAR
ncbi:plastocyanin/azurin family copper-binding protein [Hoeflea sp. YIM 152468]|uniref:plastocyanin/azurin family copper-binding protein n=1 Tax=Hoeflea sp. YIM 152468 TaxID=3031759 RepID=UPI0023D9E503|nr:plastocyanin/azurin family copper-binding protein [Hoeflea sp. YIM 152468]MDF1609931.1 plastocyanin/azurin family copper-binding protein [Hoeflea sp. YIM 152468]